jgi:hypothetical protein
MNTRELRLALKEKLEHRRELMEKNSALRVDIDREKSRNKFLLDVLGNPLVNMELERCADEIMRAVIDQAVKASSVVADQTVDSGDYEVGIDIPSLRIRKRIFRMDVDDFSPRYDDRSPLDTTPFKRVRYDVSKND